MKTKIIHTSDIHLNQNLDAEIITSEITKQATQHAQYLNEIQATHYIINGDISWVQEQIDLYLTIIKELFNGVVRYNLGNHCLSKHLTVDEYINLDKKDYLPTNPIITDNLVIIGNSGFFDFTYSHKFTDGKYISDTLMKEVHSRYFKGDEIDYLELKSILPRLLEKSQELLDNIKKSQEFENKRLVFVTHYMPRHEFLSSNLTEQTFYKNSFMGSDKIGDFLEENNFDECYFGHTHRRIPDREINGVRYYCNPVGTIREWKKRKFVDLDYFTLWKTSLLEIK